MKPDLTNLELDGNDSEGTDGSSEKIGVSKLNSAIKNQSQIYSLDQSEWSTLKEDETRKVFDLRLLSLRL